ncbi:ornithine carbamoyltransferase [Streptomyces eurythermus]|uniref:ornithine carbamoyltransferase n=1 Tax=Streptomyces eurythermus TaxID=42237 RepID=UPI0033CAD6F6
MSGARRLVSLEDLDDGDLERIVRRGVSHSAGTSVHHEPLAGQVVGIYFGMTSTRTRTAFWSSALRLGAHVITFGPSDLQTNTGEASSDTGRVLSGMLDLLVARTGRPTGELADWAGQHRMPVVNAMTEEEHPTQALADLTTLRRHFGSLEGLRVLYVGEGNNTASALALALGRTPGVELQLRTPPGYGLDPRLLELAQEHARRCGAHVVESHRMEPAPRGFDVVYTTRWQTTGTTKPDPDWRRTFRPFQVTRELWRGSPEAVFMHDLPAHRGEEVTADVLDGPMSIAFQQAENKMHSAMAVLEWCHGAPMEDRGAGAALGEGRTGSEKASLW